MFFWLESHARGLEVVEKSGGFRFTLPDDFSTKPNPRKGISPATQFDIQFSRKSHCIVTPAGWRDASIDVALATTLKLAADGFGTKLTEVERKTVKSKSGVSVTRLLARAEGGDFPFIVVAAFSPGATAAVTYTFIPGELQQNDALRIVDRMIESLALKK